MRLFGRRRDKTEAELDRETEEARRRHEERLKERSDVVDALRAEVDEMPEVAITLEAGEFAFASVYSTPIAHDMPDGFKPQYGMTVPADRVLAAFADPDWKRLLLTYASFKPADGGRSSMPWDYARLSNRNRPEVYTISKLGMENLPEDLDRLIAQFLRLEARNRPRDCVFEGKRLKVHLRPYVYWTGSLSYDKLGIGLSFKRVGVYLHG